MSEIIKDISGTCEFSTEERDKAFTIFNEYKANIGSYRWEEECMDQSAGNLSLVKITMTINI